VNYNAIDYNNNYYISKNFTTKMCEREGGRERGRERERERESTKGKEWTKVVLRRWRGIKWLTE
jgi:hypothetical protein